MSSISSRLKAWRARNGQAAVIDLKRVLPYARTIRRLAKAKLAAKRPLVEAAPSGNGHAELPE